MYSSLDFIKQQFLSELSSKYTERECLSLFYRIIEYCTGMQKVDVVLDLKKELTESQAKEIETIITALKEGVPVQYIDNTAHFLDNMYYVDGSVLIPRPETEELVTWVLDNHNETAVKVLDIGTGSGVIPISLAKSRPNWSVLACDVSNEALITARRNAREILTHSEVAFYHEDILNAKSQYNGTLDMIISNPPYVLESDKQMMDDNVLKYEPGLALFVSDKDPLLFYNAIAKYAKTNLKKGGHLYFEIHEMYADQVQRCMTDVGFEEITVKEDLQGKPRMICGRLV